MLHQYTVLLLVVLKTRKILLLQLVLVEILVISCGNNRHPRKNCPACEDFCNKCKKKGHFAKVCYSKRSAVSAAMHQINNNASQPPFLAAFTAGVNTNYHYKYQY